MLSFARSQVNALVFFSLFFLFGVLSEKDFEKVFTKLFNKLVKDLNGWDSKSLNSSSIQSLIIPDPSPIQFKSYPNPCLKSISPLSQILPKSKFKFLICSYSCSTSSFSFLLNSLQAQFKFKSYSNFSAKVSFLNPRYT